MKATLAIPTAIAAACLLAGFPLPMAGEAAETATLRADSVPDKSATPDSVTELQNLEIEVRAKLVTSDGAKLTYDVSEDPQAGTANILEILRKVPGVSVDAEDNVKVNGQSNFKILMNNREDGMLSGDLKTALKTIPAASIKKIEVISEPGAKYDAEGTGGILNIVTNTTSRLSGFMSNYRLWFSNRSLGANVNARTKLNKVMLGAMVSYNNGRLFTPYNHSYSETENLTGSEDYMRISHSKSKWYYQSSFVKLDMSWEPDTCNLFTFSGFGNFGQSGGSTFQDFTMHNLSYNPADPDASEVWRINRRTHSNSSSSYGNLQASYQHSFGRADNNLVLSYLFTFGGYKPRTVYTSEMSENAPREAPYVLERGPGDDLSHVMQVDYINQFSPKHLLESGAKVQLNRDSKNSLRYTGSDASDLVPDEENHTDVDQLRDIYALYSSYTGSFSKWSVKGGLRYEYTRMGLRYHVGDFSDFTTTLSDLVPNAAVSYNLATASSLRLAYQMRISRPGLWVLNPHVDKSDPNTISYGNPDLKSTKSHNVSLAYTNYMGVFSGGATFIYTHIGNSITDVWFIRDNIIHGTYANLGRRDDYRLDLNCSWTGVRNLQLSGYFSGAYTNMRADSELLSRKKDGWQCTFNFSADYTLPCKLRLSGYGGYWSPWFDLLSKGDSGYYYGISASRSFLKDDALSLSVSASQFLNPIRRNSYSTDTETMRMYGCSSFKQWNVGLNISWRFGALKANVKQTVASVESEEAGGSSSQSGGK